MSAIPPALNRKRIDSPIYRLDGICDNAAANLVSVLKGFVLIPIPIGATHQEIGLQPVPLLAEAMSLANQQKLSTASIAAALGVGGLIAILLNRRAQLMEFLGRNPALAGTLITGHGDASVIWTIADLLRQVPISTSNFSVLTDGKIMAFNRTATAQPSYFLTLSTPLRIDLEVIDWGPDSDGQIASWLVCLRHGEFFRRNHRGVIKPNVEAWTAYVAKRLKPVLRCNPGDRGFEERDVQDGRWIAIGSVKVLERIQEEVKIAPIGPDSAKAKMDAKWIHSVLLPKIRAALYCDHPMVDDFVARFIQEVIYAEKRANFTLKEFYRGYEQLRQARGWPGFSAWDLGKSVRRLMAGPAYLKRVSKSVHRENGNNDGYRGFGIQLPEDLSLAREKSVAAA